MYRVLKRSLPIFAIAGAIAMSAPALAQYKSTASFEVDCEGVSLFLGSSELPPNIDISGQFDVIATHLDQPGFDCMYPVAMTTDDQGEVDAEFRFAWCEPVYGTYLVRGSVTSGDLRRDIDQEELLICSTCGNGVVDGEEACDDGNDVDNDACRNDCTLSMCGDGIVDQGEECDDGNDDDSDDCQNDCTVPSCEGRIGNFVWNDGVAGATGECDGVQPVDGSMGINGVEVSLHDAAGEMIASTTTGEVMIDGALMAGYYSFNDLCAGTYEVRVVNPDDLNPAPTGEGDPATDSDDSPVVVTLATNDAVDMDTDFGFCGEELGDQGCTPGYWKNQRNAWSEAGYSRRGLVGDLFSNASIYHFDHLLLKDALRRGDRCDTHLERAARKLIRAGVAAVLSASHPDVDYGMSVGAIVDAVNDALETGDKDAMLELKDQLSALNNAGCPLNADGHCPGGGRPNGGGEGSWGNGGGHHGGHHGGNRGGGRRGDGRRGGGRW